MSSEAEGSDNSNADETPQVAPQVAASPTKTAEQKTRLTPLQQLADHEAKKAAIIAQVRKQETRGKILIGASLIGDAANDFKKLAYLKGLAGKAEDRDRVAIETACAKIF